MDTKDYYKLFDADLAKKKDYIRHLRSKVTIGWIEAKFERMRNKDGLLGLK